MEEVMSKKERISRYVVLCLLSVFILTPFVLDSPFTKTDIKWLHNNKFPAGDQGEKINEIIKGML